MASSGGEPPFPICVAVDASRRKRTFAHRRRGSRRADGSGSCLFAGHQAPARKVQFALLRPRIAHRDRDRIGRYRAQPFDDGAGLIEPTHMRVAGRESAVRRREAWILLDRQEELRYRLVEAPADGVFPQGFYVTTNQQTFVRVKEKWIEVQPATMD